MKQLEQPEDLVYDFKPHTLRITLKLNQINFMRIMPSQELVAALTMMLNNHWKKFPITFPSSVKDVDAVVFQLDESVEDILAIEVILPVSMKKSVTHFLEFYAAMLKKQYEMDITMKAESNIL